MRVLVVGCGGVGGVVAAHLARHSHDVTVLTTNGAVAAAIERRGLRLRTSFRGPRNELSAAVRLAHRELSRGIAPFEVVLLATQPPEVEGAAQAVQPWLLPEGRVVCFQNGLCEDRVARRVGRERVIGAVVVWGASMPEPGLAVRTSAGGFNIGRLDLPPDEPLKRVAELLGAVGPVHVTRNLRGVRWSKLAVNCAVSTLGTIGGEPVGVLMRRHDARQLGIEVVTEAITVARAEGVTLERLAGWVNLEWIQLTEREQAAHCFLTLALKHLTVLAAAVPYRRLRSSMLAAIERGRAPAVDFLNGEVIERAVTHRLEVPVNIAVRDAVWAIARGELKPSVQALHAVFEKTRGR